jgi:hypothetical protein
MNSIVKFIFKAVILISIITVTKTAPTTTVAIPVDIQSEGIISPVTATVPLPINVVVSTTASADDYYDGYYDVPSTANNIPATSTPMPTTTSRATTTSTKDYYDQYYDQYDDYLAKLNATYVQINKQFADYYDKYLKMVNATKAKNYDLYAQYYDEYMAMVNATYDQYYDQYAEYYDEYINMLNSSIQYDALVKKAQQDYIIQYNAQLQANNANVAYYYRYGVPKIPPFKAQDFLPKQPSNNKKGSTIQKPFNLWNIRQG